MTANTLIKAAFRAINAIDPNETPKNYLMALGLEALNIMLDSWAAERLMVYFVTYEEFSLTGGDLDLSIGSGGDLDTVRPTKITSAYTSGIGVNVRIDIVGEARYRGLSIPSLVSVPKWLYYNPVHPLGMIYLYPSPQDGLTLHLSSMKKSTDAAATTDVDFPPEYSAPIKWNLAEELAPEHGRNVNPIVSIRAVSTKRTVKNLNAASLLEAVEVDVTQAVGRYHYGRHNIDAG